MLNTVKSSTDGGMLHFANHPETLSIHNRVMTAELDQVADLDVLMLSVIQAQRHRVFVTQQQIILTVF
jgi:hypothetical protein